MPNYWRIRNKYLKCIDFGIKKNIVGNKCFKLIKNLIII